MNKPDRNLLDCPACGEPTELPYLFCDHCGAPRVRLGEWRLLLNLSVAFGAFMSIYLAKDFLAWSWPLYAWFWFFYIQFGLVLMAGRTLLKIRLFTWNIVFFLVFFAIFLFMQSGETRDFLFFFIPPHAPLEPDFMLGIIGALPGVARDYPIPFCTIGGGALVSVFGICYIHWGRRYGWVIAYRIVILSLMALCGSILLCVRLGQFCQEHGYWPNINWKGLLEYKADYYEYLLWFTINLGRLFLIEIVGYSAIRSYAVVHRKPTARLELAPGESALVRSMLRLVAVMQFLYHVLEQMVLYLLGTLLQLARDMGMVVRAFLRELAVPTLSLIATAIMFYLLVGVTKAYIETDQSGQIGRLLTLFAGTLLSLMIFVGCKTPYRWRRLLSFYGEMLAWLLPNLMVFFLLMSVSLWATAQILNGSNNENLHLPYRMGPMTGILGAIMAVMFVVTIIRKRALIARPPQPAAAPASAAKPKAQRHWGLVFGWGGLGRVADQARRKAEDLGLDEKARRARELAGGAAGFIKDRLHGRPFIVEKLERANERYHAKMAQLGTLSNMQASVDGHTYERLTTQYRNELKLLKAEREQALLEYHRTLEQRQEEMTGLRAEQVRLDQRRKEIADLHEAGALNEADFKRERRALEAEAKTLAARTASCQEILDAIATEAAGPN